MFLICVTSGADEGSLTGKPSRAVGIITMSASGPPARAITRSTSASAVGRVKPPPERMTVPTPGHHGCGSCAKVEDVRVRARHKPTGFVMMFGDEKRKLIAMTSEKSTSYEYGAERSAGLPRRLSFISRSPETLEEELSRDLN
jgi:hypothetical protein